MTPLSSPGGAVPRGLLPARSPAGDFGDVALSDADLAWAEGTSGHRLRGRLRGARSEERV